MPICGACGESRVGVHLCVLSFGHAPTHAQCGNALLNGRQTFVTPAKRFDESAVFSNVISSALIVRITIDND